jgi:4-carboxymuconolactone decarboxylase
MTQDRLPPIPQERWNDDQRRYAQEIIDGPRGALITPFIPLLRSPELMAHSQRMGEYLRYRSAIGLRLSELAILVTARHWSQPAEWAIHAPIAVRAGVAQETVRAIAQGRRPSGMPDDEQVVYDFCIELHERMLVGDGTWTRAVAALGEQGTVDLIGINGYYAYLAMLMNAARTPAPHAAGDSSLAPRLEAAALAR